MCDAPFVGQAFEAMPTAAAVLDPDTGEITRVNRTFAKQLGFEPSEVCGRSFVDLAVDLVDAPGFDSVTEVADAVTTQFECVLETADGDQIPVEVTINSVNHDGDDMMVSVIRERIEARVETSRDRSHERDRQYHELVERLPVAYYTFDSDWSFTYCNERLADRQERSVEDLLGTNLWEEFPELKGTVVEEMFRRVRETGEPGSCEYHFDDAGHWAEIEAYPYEDGIAAVSTDITEQRQYLSAILDTTPLIFYRIDTNGIILESRGKGLEGLGLEAGELVGEDVFDVYADHEGIVEMVERALEGDSVGTTIELGGVFLQLEHTPIVEGDEFIGTMGVAMDVTDIERQRQQMEFFNSILRHDVLNGMTVIKTRGEVLLDRLSGDNATYAQTIVDWCDTTTDVTQRVRQVIEALTTPEEEQPLHSVNVSTLLAQRISGLERAYPEVHFDADLERNVHVEADELLVDALGNILTNAIEHNDKDGLHIRTTIEEEGANVYIRIADNGAGVPEDRRQSIFRRGVTSHAKETGSGFGLFFVDAMVHKYGGDVWVEESEAGGACFIVVLQRHNTETHNE